MPWWIMSVVANVAIIATEYMNRTAPAGAGWGPTLLKTAPLILLAQFCLFRAFNGAPHWFTAWAVFTVGNSIMRVGAVSLSDDSVGNWPLATLAVGIMVSGAFVLKTALK